MWLGYAYSVVSSHRSSLVAVISTTCRIAFMQQQIQAMPNDFSAVGDLYSECCNHLLIVVAQLTYLWMCDSLLAHYSNAAWFRSVTLSTKPVFVWFHDVASGIGSVLAFGIGIGMSQSIQCQTWYRSDPSNNLFRKGCRYRTQIMRQHSCHRKFMATVGVQLTV